MITAAAIQRKSDNKVWIGTRHKYIVGEIMLELGLSELPADEYQHGFLTYTGAFVDRAQALKVAIAAEQVKPDKDWSVPFLYSEDIW